MNNHLKISSISIPFLLFTFISSISYADNTDTRIMNNNFRQQLSAAIYPNHKTVGSVQHQSILTKTYSIKKTFSWSQGDFNASLKRSGITLAYDF